MNNEVIVRRPGKAFFIAENRGVGIPNPVRAAQQHMELCEALQKAGVGVRILNADPDFPMGIFVRDMAVVTEHVAVLSNFREDHPRQGEQRAAASLLAGTHFIKFVTPPGLLDAGDVLAVGDKYFIALTENTNAEGASQLAVFLREFGHETEIVDLSDTGVERLSEAAVDLGGGRLLLVPELELHYAFLAYDKIVVPAAEPDAARAFMARDTLILPLGCPVTRDALRLRGIAVAEVALSEFEKMDGGVSGLVLPVPRAVREDAGLSLRGTA